jgi:ATP-binding protein involved in chromosome partitioning
MDEAGSLAGPKKIITASGKGGVGKTTVSLGIAMALARFGYKVGIVDTDIESSSMGDVLGLDNSKLTAGELLNPIEVHGIWAVSLSMFLPDESMLDTPTLIREDRVSELIHNLFTNVNWGGFDYLICDTPPGTGPELQALVKENIDAVILVTGAQRVSEMPVRRLIRAAREEFRLPVLGIVENNPYNANGDYSSGASLTERYDLPVIASIPWDAGIIQAMDNYGVVESDLFTTIADTIEAYFIPDVTQRVREVARWYRQGLSRPDIATQMGVSPGRIGQLIPKAKVAGLIT